MKPHERLLRLTPRELNIRFKELRRRLVSESEGIEFQIIDLLLQKHVRLDCTRSRNPGASVIELDPNSPTAEFLRSCDRDLMPLYLQYDEAVAAKRSQWVNPLRNTPHTPATVIYG